MRIGARVATGIPLVAFGIVVDFLPQAVFAACTSVVVMLAAREWAALCGLVSAVRQAPFLAAVAGALALAWLFEPVLALPLSGAALLFWLTALAAVAAAGAGRFDLGRWPRLRLWSGVAVLVPAWSALSYLHEGPTGAWQVLALLLLVWSADIAAYYGGRSVGRRPLCPAISPGKTLEGALAGIGAGLFVGLALAALQNLPPAAMIRFVVLAVAVTALSIVGDLFESMLKRSANRKDSGTLLPGHGGVLDRIDSITAAAPVFALGVHVAGLLP
jgi:phosphatidate cytidylyltransferase